MALFKDFTFDGENSKDYGVYISGEAVYDAPERAMDMVQIPGRNGALALDNGYYNNIPVTYPAGIYADSQQDFAAKLSRIRNMLASRHRYCRLEDSYHPDYFRLALYRSGLDVSPVAINRAGRFNITFDAKPQRFLKTGEEIQALDTDDPPTEVYGPADIVTFQGKLGDSIVSSVLQLDPVQDLHGYDAPWPAGGGKNKFDKDNANIINGYIGSTKINSDSNFRTVYIPCSPNTTYTASKTWLATDRLGIAYTETTPAANVLVYGVSTKTSGTTGARESVTVTTGANAQYVVVWVGYADTVDYGTVQIELGSTATAYAPYSNICPITGWMGANIVVSPTLDAQDGTTYSVTWRDTAGTVYGGTLDVTSGVLTVDREYRVVHSGDVTRVQNATGYAIARLGDLGYVNAALDQKCNVLELSTAPASSIPLWSFHCINSEGYGQAQVVFKFNFSSSTQAAQTQKYNDALAALETAGTPMTVVFGLAEPQTYQLTPADISVLLGTNNIFSNAGPVTITVQSPFELENPTLYPSKPLIRVYGSGTIQVNDVTITVAEHSGYIDIDCDLMDCYRGADNMNQYVSFSGNDFPELIPGVNRILLNGPDRVEITPRWWEL